MLSLVPPPPLYSGPSKTWCLDLITPAVPSGLFFLWSGTPQDTPAWTWCAVHTCICVQFPINLTTDLTTDFSSPLSTMISCTKCTHRFQNPSGFKRHFNTVHSYHPGLDVPVAELQRNHHPLLTGASSFCRVDNKLLCSPSQAM